MRCIAVVLLAACGSSSESGPGSAIVPDDHKLHDLGKDAPDVLRMAWFGKQVSLADLPMVNEQVGLPVTGTADVAIDIEVPKTGGTPDFRRAKGTVSIACTKCQIGDDQAKLKPKARNARQSAFVGDGIAFGHIAIDSFDAKLVIGAGRAELTSWKLVSPDLGSVSMALGSGPPFEQCAQGLHAIQGDRSAEET
jgi:hypothetical protein